MRTTYWRRNSSAKVRSQSNKKKSQTEHTDPSQFLIEEDAYDGEWHLSASSAAQKGSVSSLSKRNYLSSTAERDWD